jgi:hypothetical protein
MAVTFSNIGLQEPSTITNRVAAVTVARGSTNEQQEILVLGDPETSNALARVVAAQPDSTHFGVVTRSLVYAGSSESTGYFPVRIVDSSGTGFAPLGVDYTDGSTISTFIAPGLTFNNSSNDTMRLVGLTTPFPVQITDSSNAAVKPGDSVNNAIRVNVIASSGASTVFTISTVQGAVIMRSSAADAAVRVYQSTATDLNCVVSSVGGAVIMRSSAADAAVRVYQSTATDLVTAARVYTSSGGALEGSTASPSSGTLGLHVRPIAPARGSAYSTILSTASTAWYTIVSSVTARKIVARGYSVTSTAVTPLQVLFYSGTNTVLWHTGVGSGSSGLTGANFGLSNGLFETASADPLQVRLTSTGVEVAISLSYFTEA